MAQTIKRGGKGVRRAAAARGAARKVDRAKAHTGSVLDAAKFIAAALSPAQVLRVDILDRDQRLARAVVPDGQTSLAIGKEAQNVRLAAKLTNWSIDIRKESEDPGADG